jgi:hypothetical protein
MVIRAWDGVPPGADWPGVASGPGQGKNTATDPKGVRWVSDGFSLAGWMGFWAMSNETDDEALDWELNMFDRFIKDLPVDTRITVVDCHI